jgi:hypothetical protein
MERQPEERARAHTQPHTRCEYGRAKSPAHLVLSFQLTVRVVQRLPRRGARIAYNPLSCRLPRLRIRNETRCSCSCLLLYRRARVHFNGEHLAREGLDRELHSGGKAQE